MYNKFKVGDRVKQTYSGYNTSPHDTGKEATVVEIGGSYSGRSAIIINADGWYHKDAGWRAENAFELVLNPEWDK